MTGTLRGRLWRLLGGATDDDGNPTASPDDLVVVFEGDPRDARELQQALSEAGVVVVPEVYVPSRAYTSEAPRAVISVAVADELVTREIVKGFPHLGNTAADWSFGPTPRPRGFATVAEFDSEEQAQRATDVLEQAGVRSLLTPPAPDGFGGVGYLVSVGVAKLDPAAKCLSDLAAAGPPGEFTPRNLWSG